MDIRIKVVAAVIRKNGRLLLTSRPENKPPHGLEFPGGKVEPGETLADALRRELTEELGINSIVFDPLYCITTQEIELWFLRTMIPEGETISCREDQQCFWIDPDDKKETETLFSKIPLLPNDSRFWSFLNCR